MSQNLTQPEEVDYALVEMYGETVTTRMQISTGTQLNEDAHGFECDWSIGSTGFSCDSAQHKSVHG